MTSLEKIRAACVAANKEIDQREIDRCVCGHKWLSHDWPAASEANWEFRYDWGPCKHCVCRKFGDEGVREIRLADVLLAIGQQMDRCYLVDMFGKFWSVRYGTEGLQDQQWHGSEWNLRADDINLQRKETQDFIASLLPEPIEK